MPHPPPVAVTLGESSHAVALANHSEFPGGCGWTPDGCRRRIPAVRTALRSAARRTQDPADDGDVLWIRFVARVADRDARWLLEVDLPGVDDASFYYRNAAGALVVQRSGDSLAQSHWTERGRMPFFP